MAGGSELGPVARIGSSRGALSSRPRRMMPALSRWIKGVWIWMWVSGRVPKRRLDSGLAIGAIASILPPATIITSPGKMPAIISLSGTGICGEEDFRCRGQGNATLPARMAGILQVEKSRYVLDNIILSKPLKERIDSYRRRPFLLKENSTAAFTGLPPISSTG